PRIASSAPNAASTSPAFAAGGSPVRLQLVDTTGCREAPASAAAVGCGEQRNPTPSGVATPGKAPAATGTTRGGGPGQKRRPSRAAAGGRPGAKRASAAASATSSDRPRSASRPLAARRRASAAGWPGSAPSPYTVSVGQATSSPRA